MQKINITILLSLLSIVLLAQDFNHPSVFYSNRGQNKNWIQYKNNHEALYKIICNEAFELLDKRKIEVNKLNSKEDWDKYRNDLKSKVFASMAKIEKTPLQSKITGVINKETFTVEKVLFESHPGFYVTGCLFIPKERQRPAPTVIYCSGHTELAFRSETYQQVILNLVAKGFIVFGLDPIGQGERLQYLNHENGKSKIGGSTKEHTFAGIQTLLSGTSLSDYFIWDGVRTIDYLLTRQEVDANRIGITGRSGGGTQAAQIAAFDERIYAAAPECYLTTFERLLQSIGPQDAEQNLYRAIKQGFDHPDYLHLRAPKPSLIITTTHDYFSQQGARECFAEAKKSYSVYGKAENVEFTEDYGKHESTKNNREALYDFFQRHLKNPGDSSDKEVEKFKAEELWVTQTGQLQSSVGGKTIFDLNRDYFQKTDLSREELKIKMNELSGTDFSRKLKTEVYTGLYKSNNVEVEKYFLENNKKDYALPVYVVRNDFADAKRILIYLSEDGKSGVLEHNELDPYLQENYTIVSADLPGLGELQDVEFTGDGFISGVPFNYTFGANLTGKSIPGIQAEAIDLLVQFIHKKYPNKEIEVFCEGTTSTAVLVYATQINVFKKVYFKNALDFSTQIINTEYYDPRKAYSIIPGSLTYFNFEELSSNLPAIKLD